MYSLLLGHLLVVVSIQYLGSRPYIKFTILLILHQGEKYFVLKRPKEAPAVLRKPVANKPPRPHPSSYKSRPISGPPVMQNAKMFEDMLSSQKGKGHPPGSVGHAAEVEKENHSDVRSLAREHMRKAGSVDSMDVSTIYIIILM